MADTSVDLRLLLPRRSARRWPDLTSPSAAGIASAGVAILVLVGWLANILPLTTLGIADEPVKPNAAIGLLCLGVALHLRTSPRRRSLAIGLFLVAGAIGFATLTEYWTGINLGIDQVLFADNGAHIGVPGRMSPLAALSLCVLAVAGVFAGSGRRGGWAVIVAGLGVFGVATLTLLNAVFGGVPPAILDASTQMHPATAALLGVLSYGVVELLGPENPLRFIRGSAESALMSRRVLLAAVCLVVILGFLRVRGEVLGLYDSRFGAALMVVITILALIVVIVAAAAAGEGAERQRAAVQNERDRFFDLSLDLLATATGDGRFIRLNRAWETTLGYSVEELMNRPFLDYVHPDDQSATLYELDRQFRAGKTVLHFQNRYRHRDGSYRWLEWTSQPSADGSVVYAVARDITTRKHEEERLTKRAAALAARNERLADRAVRDPLTGLHNRAYLQAAITRLGSAARRGDADQNVSVIMFDLDHFGTFNKLYGHQAGDAVLQRFAAILKERFRGGDVVARYGGEEFLVIMPRAARDDATHAAEDVRREFEGRPTEFDGSELEATVSAGCADVASAASLGDALTAADAALAQAKRAGRNMVVAA